MPLTAERLDGHVPGLRRSVRGQSSTAAILVTTMRGIPVPGPLASDGGLLLLAKRLWDVDWEDLPDGSSLCRS